MSEQETLQTEAASALVEMPLNPQEVIKKFNAIQAFKESFLDKKTDTFSINGKPYILKRGCRKLAFAFNLSDEIIREEKEVGEDGAVVWRIWTKVTAPNGRHVVGVGSCSSSERKGKLQHPDHDVYALAHTRSKNRAISDILGLGEVSAEEMATTL